MPLNFPASPNLNDTYSYGGKTWIWNGSAWDLALSGAINDVPIGNITPSSGAFTILSATGTFTGTTVEAAQIGNSGSALTAATLNTSSNATVSALTVNNSTTIGTTLGVTGNITTAGFFLGNGSLLDGVSSVAFDNIQVVGQSNVTANATNSTFTFLAGDGIVITTDPNAANITISTSGGTTVFSQENDFGLVTEPVTESEDEGSVADSATLEVDLGTIAVQGIVETSSIVDGAVTPIKLSTGAPNWDSNGNITLGTDVVYVENQNYRVGINTLTPSTDLDVDGNIAAGNISVTGAASAGSASVTGALTAATFAGNLTGTVYSAGSIIPTANATYDLGSSSLRWNNVYTSDLSLANEHGSWTIVEGEDDLFLYNNKRGKVYKFALIEVNPEDAPPKRGT